jgi:L-fuconolactonase
MRTLSRRRNIYCKVSGLVEGTGRNDGSAPAEVRFYRPVLDTMWNLFGPERLIYGSNWPVSERFAPLATVQRIVADYCRAYDPSSEAKVFGSSAQAAYKWVQRPAVKQQAP